ncbi:MAG: SRPBCC family protein [Flavobacteriales bacterium]|nr:SRPBCC family protein [Flavobacteriales bacterium]MCX7649535.1 SRPBCC family protein [Flavobacteriales bacterium]MDW8431248.1 SRPBCC family protein [Flavobacteriales bacterium]
MKLQRFEAIQDFSMASEDLWDFISEPYNLSLITPPDMDFQILSGAIRGQKMYAGQIISYTVRPLWGVPARWVTEITHVREGEFFVDEQRLGPYAFWHHQHILEKIPGGVRMRDIVHYALPGWPLTFWLDRWIVRPRLQHIFAYRKERLGRIFTPLLKTV